MAEAAVKIHEGEGKPNISEEVKSELWDIHRALFGVVGALRMIRQSAETSLSKLQSNLGIERGNRSDYILARLERDRPDIVEVLDQYIPAVDALRIRLDSAICKLR